MQNFRFFIKKIIDSNPTAIKKITEIKIKENWHSLFGKSFDKELENLELKNGNLELTIKSSTLRDDFYRKKGKLTLELNKGIEKKYRFIDIIFY